MSAARRLVAAVIGVGLLAGCASGSPDIAAPTSGELQAAVQDIGTAAAAGHYAAAATLVDALQTRLGQAVATGQVTTERGGQIQSAIDKVRADLAALADTAASTAASTATPTTAPPAAPTTTTAPKPAATKPGPAPGKKKGKD